ncbi:MAG: HXXEE domain-containing protein [Terracidiphilus sp.]
MNTDTLKQQTFRRLIWLMPVAFALHIVEEYRGGFPAWVTYVLGGSFNNLAFAYNNAIFLVIMVGLTVWVSRSSSRLAVFLLIAWSSGNVFWDGLFHVLTTAKFDRYSPGLITASVLYLPISLLIGTSTLQSEALSVKAFLGALAVGLSLLVFVIWYGLFHFAI